MTAGLTKQQSAASHLNLRWTVGDMDRLTFARMNKRLTIEELCEKLHGSALACSHERMREICDAFHVEVKPSARAAMGEGRP